MNTLHEIDWVSAFARLHPVLLHLPIGLFLALGWLQLTRAIRSDESSALRVRAALVTLLLLTTPLTAASGWLMHESASYPDPVEWHEWFGIGLMVVALAIGWAHFKAPKAYAPLVWLGCALLLPTAHFGGTLTHGEGFLTEPFTEPEPADEVEPSVQKLTFDDVLPVFEARCVRCHGDKKQRGGLALHTLEAAQRGGDSGPAIVLGHEERSLALLRMQLPLDHEDHMPPANKSQPSPSEIERVAAWIHGEAAQQLHEQETAVDEAHVEPSPKLDDPAVAAAIDTLRERLVHVQSASVESSALWIDFEAATLEPGELRSLLEPLATSVSEVSLARKSLSPDDVTFLAELPNLASLDLSGLRQETLDLGPLRAAPALSLLKVAGTALGPNAAETLEAMKALERVYLWKTGVESDLADLRVARPDLQLEGASPAPDAPLETEAEVEFIAAEPNAPALTPINTVCPVSDQPIDARYTVVHDGRVIGFCCPNCPKSFWEDPAKFADKLEK